MTNQSSTDRHPGSVRTAGSVARPAADRGIVRQVWLLALAVGVLGLGVFLYSGSQAGILFVVVGVPAAVLAAVGLYVRRNARTRTPGTRSSANVLDKRAQQVAREWSEYVSARERASEEFTEWSPASLADEERGIVADLSAQGIEVDRDTGEPTVLDDTDRELTELQGLSRRIGDLADERDRAVESLARTELRRLDDAVERLEAANLARVDGWSGSEAIDDGMDTSAVLAAVDAQRAELADAVRRAVETIRRADELLDEDARTARERAREAYTAAERPADVEAAVEAVLSASEAAEAELADALATRVAALDDTTEAVLGAADYLPDDLVDDVRRVQSSIATVDSVTEVGTLERAESDLRRWGVEAVDRLESTLDDRVDTLRTSDVPDEFYERPAQLEIDHTRAIETAGSPAELASAVETAVEDLEPVMGALDERANVATAFPDVEPFIERRLDGTDRLTADDIDVEPPGLFMRLYALEHDDASYDPETTELRS